MVEFWNGRLPLTQAFWTYAILYGTTANLVSTLGGLAALTLDFPGALSLAIFLLPLPYVFVAVVGVFRSASHYSGPSEWANGARITVLVWAALMVVL